MIPQFKIRCSAIGSILGGVGRPTEKQLAELGRLQGLPKRTIKQDETLADLIKRREAKPTLQDGAKTYCQNWLKEKIYSRRQEFSNKCTEKGIRCEDAAIKLVADTMGYGMVFKNEKQFENDYMTGTPDLLLTDIVEDIKNSWSVFTFPLFATELPNSDYYYQLQGYMVLTGRKKAAVNYCLIDAPVEIMDREARKVWYGAGNEGDIEMECYDEVYAKMTYPDIPDTLKLKRFAFEQDTTFESTVKERVELCREYIKTIMPSQEILNQLIQAA